MGSRNIFLVIGVGVVIAVLAIASIVQSRVRADRIARENAEAAEMRLLKDEFEQIRADSKNRIDSKIGMLPSDGVKNLERAVDALDKSSKGVGADNAAEMRAAAAAARKMQLIAKPYAEASAELIKRSPLKPDWVKEEGDLVAYNKQIDQFKKSCDEMRAMNGQIETYYHDALIAEGLSPDPAKTSMRLLRENAADFALIRDADDVLVVEFHAVTALLQREWGKWHMEKDQLLFDKVEAASEFKGIVKRIEDAGEMQHEAQRRVAEKMSP